MTSRTHTWGAALIDSMPVQLKKVKMFKLLSGIGNMKKPFAYICFFFSLHDSFVNLSMALGKANPLTRRKEYEWTFLSAVAH